MSAESKKRRRAMRGGLMPNLRLKRIPVTNRDEADRIRAENAERFAEVTEEKRNEREQEIQLFDARNAPVDLSKTGDEAWTPPRTLEDFVYVVKAAHPDWTEQRVQWEAKVLLERHPLIEAAFLDGLKMGRTLREAAEYGHGWDWPSLHNLLPSERTWVLGQVYRTVMRDKPKVKREKS